MKIALVGCSKEKLAYAAPARDLYTSPLFRAARTWAEANCDGWFILSAKHGLVHPDAVTDPYDAVLPSRREERRAWAALTQAAIVATVPADAELVVLAGERYAGALAGLANLASFPLHGFEIGERLAWLRRENYLAELWARARAGAEEGGVEFSPDEIRMLLAERDRRAA